MNFFEVQGYFHLNTLTWFWRQSNYVRRRQNKSWHQLIPLNGWRFDVKMTFPFLDESTLKPQIIGKLAEKVKIVFLPLYNFFQDQ